MFVVGTEHIVMVVSLEPGTAFDMGQPGFGSRNIQRLQSGLRTGPEHIARAHKSKLALVRDQHWPFVLIGHLSWLILTVLCAYQNV